MRPTIAQIEAFYWVFKLGSVKEASKHLNITQPTTTLRIQEMEAQLGRQLFSREERRMVLTRYGETILPRARLILDEVVSINALASSPQEIRGVVRLGCAEAFALVCLPQCIQQLRSLHPALDIEIKVSTSADLEASVKERRLDIAFVINPIGDPNLALLQLGVQDVAWFVRSTSPLSRKVSAFDLRDWPIMITSHGSPMYRQTLEWFREAGLEPTNLTFCNSLYLIKQFVASSDYASLLPRRMMQLNALAIPTCRELSSTGSQPLSRIYSVYRFSDVSPTLNAVNEIAKRVISTLSYS